MVEIRLKKCCLTCEYPKIKCIDKCTRRIDGVLSGDTTIFCDSEMVCDRILNCLSGYIKNA